MKSGAGLKYKVHTQCGRTGLEEHQIRPARLSSLCLKTSQLKRSKSVHVKACNYALLCTEHDMIYIISSTWLRSWGVRLTFVYCVRVSHASTAAVYLLNLVHSLPFSSFYHTILNTVQLSTLIGKCSIEHFPIKVIGDMKSNCTASHDIVTMTRLCIQCFGPFSVWTSAWQ